MRIKTWKLFLESILDDPEFFEEMRQKMEPGRIKLRDSVIDLFLNLESGAKGLLNLPKEVRGFFLEEYLNIAFRNIKETTLSIMKERSDMTNPYFESALRVMETLWVKFKPIFINESFHIGATLFAEEYTKMLFDVMCEISRQEDYEREWAESEAGKATLKTIERESDMKTWSQKDLQKAMDDALEKRDFERAREVSKFIVTESKNSGYRKEIEELINSNSHRFQRLAKAIVDFCEEMNRLEVK